MPEVSAAVLAKLFMGDGPFYPRIGGWISKLGVHERKFRYEENPPAAATHSARNGPENESTD